MIILQEAFFVRFISKCNRFISGSPFFLMLTVLFFAVILPRIIFLSVPPFQSDESVYIYSSYAISRGEVPYRDIVLNHPPVLYVYYALIIDIVANNMEAIRFSVAILHFAVIVGVVLIIREFASRLGHNFTMTSLIAASLLAVFPALFVFSMIGTAETILNLFLVFSTLFLIRGTHSRKSYIISGIFFGLAFFTKFLVSLFLIPIILLLLLPTNSTGLNKKIGLYRFSIGFAFVSVVVLSYLSLAGALGNFIDQTVYFQLDQRPPMTFEQRGELFSWFSNSFALALLCTVPGALFLVKHYLRTKITVLLFPIFMYIPLVLQLLILPSLYHHLLFVMPIIFIMVGFTFHRSILPLREDSVIISAAKIAFFLSIAVLAYQYAQTASTNPHQVAPYVFSLEHSVYTNVEKYVASEVSRITDHNDKIWTSEGAIAFFADRVISTPSSEKWPVAAFFDDWLSRTIDGTTGNNLVATSDFINQFEIDKTKVVVVILNRGWVPYPDPVLMESYDGEDGMRAYLEDNYVLYHTINAEGNPYSYQIWLRKA